MMKDTKKIKVHTKTIDKYLSSENKEVLAALKKIISAVQAAASQSIETIQREREIMSDVSDYLDGVLSQYLNISQIEELRDIALLSQELEVFCDQIVFRRAFPDLYAELREKTEQLKTLEKISEELKEKTERVKDLEKILEEQSSVEVEPLISKQDLEKPPEDPVYYSTTSKGLFENAFKRAEKVIEQNKITRFVSSTVFRFHEEFDQLEKNRDVNYISKLFQETIEPFQFNKVETSDDGKFTKFAENAFSKESYQSLFLFFYRYYNELLDIYEQKKELPSANEELDRIFRKKPKGIEKIISQMHAKRMSLRP